MRIRPEIPADRRGVREVNAAAFGAPAEADLVDRLRATARPLVSLVAEERDGGMVGHILFSPVTLDPAPPGAPLLMGLAPMCVAPDLQRGGVGTALVRAGLEECARIGAAGVVVLGHPTYYPRFGFVPASRFGLRCRYDAPDEAFMALELTPGAFAGGPATIHYDGAFDGP